MTRRDKSLNSLLRGNADSNIVFSELVAILKWLGFQERVRGSHHIFSREGVEDILNLQPRTAASKWKSEALPGEAGAVGHYELRPCRSRKSSGV
jgi:hypothetical protein